MAFETLAEGTLVADGTEQTITEASEAMRLSGYVSLSEIQAGDSIVLRQYVELSNTYKKYAEETYSGVQTNPVVYITPKESASRLKITLEQTAGASRSFAYKFIKETWVAALPKATFKT
jgi:hypothetical protein